MGKHGQNTSHAVMAQRSEAKDSLDFFPTPPWATRALCVALIEDGQETLSHLTAEDPACGMGHMVRPLLEYFHDVRGADVNDYGAGYETWDYLWPSVRPCVDWTITNPPFRLAEQFVQRAFQQSLSGVAMLVRSVWGEGNGRYETLFSVRPPTAVYQFCERVPMVKGRVDPKASTATAYSWFVWDFLDEPTDGSKAQTAYRWIPPGTRKRLEKASDYE